MSEKGLFIAIDGPDGVGKTSLVEEVRKRLITDNYDVKATKEITKGPIGKLISKHEFKGRILAELIAADRLYHIENEIMPNINDGKTVICDRYIASSFVYQQIDGLSLDYIKTINSTIIIPDLYIFLTADQQIISQRLAVRPILTRMETIDQTPIVNMFNNIFKMFERQNVCKSITLTNNVPDDININADKIINLIKNNI